MRQFTLPKNSVKLLVILGLAIGSALFLYPKRNISQSEIKKFFPTTAEKRFSEYSKKQLKKIGYRAFESNAFEKRDEALDKRLMLDQAETRTKRYLFSNKTMMEWNLTVKATSIDSSSASLEAVSSFKSGNETAKHDNKVECETEKNTLPSGVVLNDLRCSSLKTAEALEKVDVEFESCAVDPVGNRPIKKETKYGTFTTASGQVFLRVVYEKTEIFGDVICNGLTKGLGNETRVSIYTHEAPNVVYPAVGSAKQLYQARTLLDSKGRTIYRSLEEMLDTNAVITAEQLALVEKVLEVPSQNKNAKKFKKSSKSAAKKSSKKMAAL